MKLQVIEDAKGKATGVFIPISEWKKLQKRYNELVMPEHDEPSMSELLDEIKQAVLELKSIEQGKLKAKPANEFINEL